MGTTTPKLQLPYPVSSDPADVPADMGALATRLEAIWPMSSALAAAPPATPFDGQIWQTSPTAGVVWTFRYNAGSASAYKWEFVGGAPLVSVVAAKEAYASAAYAALPTPGPNITPPRSGDYLLGLGATILNNAAAAATGMMSYGTASVGAVDADAIEAGFSATLSVGGSYSAVQSKPGLVGATALLAQYKSVGATSIFFSKRFIWLAPVRVS